jgi:hypothetical protein
VSAVLALAAASPVAAQRNRGFELGADAAIERTWYQADGFAPPSTTSILLPVSAIRVGFPTGSPVGFDVAGSFLHYSTNGSTGTQLETQVGVPIVLNPSARDAEWFVRPALGWQHIALTGSSGTNRGLVAAGIGVRVPATDRIAPRFEARYTYYARAAGVSSRILGFMAGVSVFTR